MKDIPSAVTTQAPLMASPAQRLTQSRNALVRHMNGEPATRITDQQGVDGYSEDSAGAVGAPDDDTLFSTVSHALSVWWRHHPFNAAADLARPVIQGYARQHPVKLLAMAAVAGAAVVIIKPWRLVSIGGLLLATVKSSGLSSVVMSLVSRRPSHVPTSKEEQHHDPI